MLPKEWRDARPGSQSHRGLDGIAIERSFKRKETSADIDIDLIYLC